MNRRKNKGFSLLEVLFGVVLAGACAAILAATMPVATSSRLKADLNNRALGLAQKEMEEVRGRGYSNLNGAALFNYKLVDSATHVESGGGGTSGTPAYQVFSFTNVDATNQDNPAAVLPSGKGFLKIEEIDTDLKRVIVEIQFTDRGRARAIRIGTYLANL